MEHSDEVILQGLLVLAIASFENALADTMRIILRRMPIKLNAKLSGVTKEDLVEGRAIEKAVEVMVRAISYGNILDMLASFEEITGAETSSISEPAINSLLESKATRNLLLHNNLMVNSDYIDTAGPLKRSLNIGTTLEVNQQYLFETIANLRGIMRFILQQLGDKYVAYTRVNAIRNLWDFVLPTPVANFENEWIIDADSDMIVRYRHENSNRRSFSHSEEFIFNLWLCHFEGFALRNFVGNFYNLSDDTRERVAFLMSEAELIRGPEDAFVQRYHDENR